MDRPYFFLLQRPGKNPVIRTHECAVSGPYGKGFARAADTRVNDRHVNGPLGKKPIARRQTKSPGADVSGRNTMSNILDCGARVDAKNDTLHRTDKPVGEAEVGGQRDQPH